MLSITPQPFMVEALHAGSDPFKQDNELCHTDKKYFWNDVRNRTKNSQPLKFPRSQPDQALAGKKQV